MKNGSDNAFPEIKKPILKDWASSKTTPSWVQMGAYDITLDLPSDANNVYCIVAWSQPSTNYNTMAVPMYVLNNGVSKWQVVGSISQTYTINYRVVYD